MPDSVYLSTVTHFVFYFSFFFECYADHLDLHSFPTRRSSDLAPCRRDSSVARPPCVQRHANRGRTPRAGQTTRTAARSEEHTSELQSRQYLVCRLLLEKKNEGK